VDEKSPGAERKIMNARDDMLTRVKAALAMLPERAKLPDWDSELAIARKLVEHRDPFDDFAERVKFANAMVMTDLAAVGAFLKNGGWFRGYCDPALQPQFAAAFGPDFLLETEFDRTRVDDFTFGITRAAGGIAETGTIILNDTLTSRRLGALTPWVHIAVLQRSQILRTMTDAVLTFGTDPNVIWVTGPSKTADIEGILIEGVHGPGVQIALVLS
jgi:L-lactate dehydrogenase complex protein LldG